MGVLCCKLFVSFEVRVTHLSLESLSHCWVECMRVFAVSKLFVSFEVRITHLSLDSLSLQ
jgi:hypothetical protein